MKRIRLYFLLFLCFLLQNVYAQYNIEGVVLETTNVPLVGASVYVVEQTDIGTITDKNGHFTLQLPTDENYTIEAAFLGYQSQQCAIQKNAEKIKIVLQEDHKELDMVVVTATRTPKHLSEAPIITRVISQEEIKKIDATHVSDLLQAELPGIEFSASMNQQMALNMTGFGGNSVLFLVDGERIAGETLDNIDYSRLNLDNVERIEIIKGATSSLYGSNAVGGVVNIISRQAKDKWSVDLKGKYGSHNEQQYSGTVGFNFKRINSITSVQYTSIDEIDLHQKSPIKVGD
ncbi:MAG: TonB-dependent receptor plug domain-containing protein, partial [Paludibacteraceae bacterium]|nr:TonB-dependent receptor plug domain-containing protein [Paludibacteraceae bacterium]